MDLEVRRDDWTISELCLSDNRRLPIESATLQLGDDEIIVPASYGDRVFEAPKTGPGFLRRIFTSDVASTSEEA